MKLSLIAATAVLALGAPLYAQSSKPNDAQIADIAYTAGQLDIDAGKQALPKLHDPAVRAFAETMIRDHTAVNQQALDLVKKLGVKPEANATSKALTADAHKSAEQLKGLNGAAYDTAYIKHEVAFHRTVNNALSKVLIPSAKNAQLKSFLETGLTLFKAHQAHAEQLAKARK
jgi:putative membrane protein